ncbi:hypothetical protein PROFUN_05916 [Planoprotostelium fungivorum]|uniref:Uncharacterized protein n=1 Tax=Planoprotostelium fungivorum TaxID=1890364 RepID=A0A2P6N7M7_9EUKA|nr:hypothetical protein PROFUN_05916 [Planoprotostelium fungivorum]
MTDKNTITIKIGRYNLSDIRFAEHWAVKINDTWYEVMGQGKKSNNSPNVIDTHNDDSKYTTITDMKDIPSTFTENDIVKWIQGWVETNQVYNWTRANCQQMVSQMISHFTRIKVHTQNTKLGTGLMLAGAATLTAAALVAPILAIPGIFIAGIGTVARGDHGTPINENCGCYLCRNQAGNPKTEQSVDRLIVENDATTFM